MNRSVTPISQKSHGARAVWLAALAGLAMAIGVVVVWWIINDRAREHIRSAANDATRINQTMIRQDIDNRLAAMTRLAERWTAAGGTPRAAWEADAVRYLTDMPGFQAIEWADATLHIRWIVPSAGNDAAQDLDITSSERSGIAAVAARESGAVQLTQPFELAQGGMGIAAYVPVYREQAFDGVIVGVLRLHDWLDVVIARVQSTNYHVRILLQGQQVFAQLVGDELVDEAWTERSDFEVHGLVWTTLITPTNEFVAAVHAGSSTLILTVGLLLSLLVAVVVYLALEARFRSLQLQDIASRLATLLQNLPGMAYQRNDRQDGTMDFASDGCFELSGYSRSDIEKQRVRWDDLILAQDRNRVRRQILEKVDAGDAFELEYRILAKNGEERWMWERGRAVTSESSHTIRLDGFISDITDRKLAEMALLEARTFSEAVVDTAADAVITIDANGEIETFNRAAQRMFGYSFEDIAGKNVNTLMPAPYDTEHDEYITHYLHTGEAGIIGTGREVNGLRKDGSVFPVYLSVSEFRDRTARKFVGLVRDISRQRAAETEAREHREQLAHMDRINVLGEMATGIAHEINQPLTAISLFAQAGMRLFGKGKNQDRLPEIFEKLTQHAHRASAVIERMQSMARRQDSTREIVDCNALVAEVAKLAESEARIRDMIIAVDMAGTLPCVNVDTVQIQQVALNLLRNGMEAMQSTGCRDGITIRLRTSLRADGDVEVAVIDNGCGVSEAVAETLFTPFSTTKDSGMGMGLAISRAIISAHGGHLDYLNNDSGGATFFFTLPVADEEELNG